MDFGNFPAQRDVSDYILVVTVELGPQNLEQPFGIAAAAYLLSLTIEHPDQGSQILFGITGIAVSYDVVVRHALRPDQAVGIIGCEAAQGSRANHPIFETSSGGACQRVRTAAGPSYYTESVNSEKIRNSLDIGGRGNHIPAFSAIRAWIAGPVVADQANAEPVQDDPARTRALTPARRAVQQEHREPVRVARTVDGQPVPIPGLDYLGHGSLPYADLAPAGRLSASPGRV